MSHECHLRQGFPLTACMMHNRGLHASMAVSGMLLVGLTMLLLALSTTAQYQGRPTGILAPDRCGTWGRLYPCRQGCTAINA